MRSRASFRGHPLHPALIPFPFAFLIGAGLFDALGWLTAEPSLWTTGGHLAAIGVLSALVAAIPGIIDYLYTVPPRSTGKQRATRHGLLNLAAVGVIAVSWVLRDDVGAGLVIAADLAGAAMLAAGSWMGGTLVTRNQISVDHRYADAGKWREATLDARPGQPVRVGAADELQVDQLKLLHIGDRRIVLGRTEDGFVAFDDRCPHRGASLADGTLICGTVQCPWHGSQFDVRSGAVKAGPAKEPIATWRIDVTQDGLFLTL
jgi:nitrite reductase/ring-hydroxylating ferredoxin subunit/uncharacterized membrane protein